MPTGDDVLRSGGKSSVVITNHHCDNKDERQAVYDRLQQQSMAPTRAAMENIDAQVAAYNEREEEAIEASDESDFGVKRRRTRRRPGPKSRVVRKQRRPSSVRAPAPVATGAKPTHAKYEPPASHMKAEHPMSSGSSSSSSSSDESSGAASGAGGEDAKSKVDEMLKCEAYWNKSFLRERDFSALMTQLLQATGGGPANE